MKYGLIVLLLSIYVSLSAQARLGHSVTEIKEEFRETKYNLKTGYNSQKDYKISIELYNSFVTYYFRNGNKYCTSTVILPKTDGALNGFVETYNKKYVILSAINWRMYSKEGVSNIELFYTTDKECYIIWTSDN